MVSRRNLALALVFLWPNASFAQSAASDAVAARMLMVAESAAAAPAEARAAWRKRIDAAHDTLLSALQWDNLHGQNNAALRTLLALGRFWNGAEYAAEWQRALTAPVGSDSVLRARSLNAASAVAFRINDQATARLWARQSIDLSAALRDTVGMGRAYQRLVQIALRDNDHVQLRALADTGQALCTLTRDGNCFVYFVNMRGESARVLQQYDSAVRYYQIADTIYRRLSPAFQLGNAHNMGFALLALRRLSEARARFKEGLQHADAAGDKPYTAFMLAGLASCDAVAGAASNAARLFGVYDTLLQQTGRIADPADVVEYERYRSIARSSLGEAGFNEATAAGRVLRADSVIASLLR